MAAIKNIAVIGVGGVGGYFGGKLCRLLDREPGLHVSFIARGEHLRAIQVHGLELCTEADGETVCRPSLATDDFAALPPLDLCLLCVKEFDLAPALRQLVPKLNERSVILPLLNGVDVYDRVRAVVRNAVVLPACVYVGTHIERPGRVVQKGGACQILLGPDPQRSDFEAAELTALFQRADIRSEFTPHIASEIWKKFTFICAFGLVTAAHYKTLGEVRDDPVLSRDVQSIMHEAIAVARRLGVPLPADIAETSFATAQDFPPDARTSFQRDFRSQDKPDERDLFAGSLIRLAAQLGVPIPTTTAVAATLAEQKPVA